MTKPAALLADQTWLRSAALRRVFAVFPDGGLRCVGGCVRDSLAGLPVKDVDLATPLAPEAVIERLEPAGISVKPTGLKHGTVTAVVDRHRFEITTLRHDVEADGRHARVAFIDDWQADAARRDLTINAIYCDPDGTVFDPYDGVGDLAAGRVRFVGDPRARIAEDYLRLLRFFRFHARFGRGAPDREALNAARELAPGLGRLSAERIRDELMRLLAGPRAGETLMLMARYGILPQVDPAIRQPGRLCRLIAAECQASRMVRGVHPDPVRRLAALLSDGDIDVGQRLRLSNNEARRIERAQATEPVMRPDFERDARRALVFDLGAETYRDRILMAWASATDANAEAWIAQLREPDHWTPPQFPVNGRDALKFGLATGPAVGQVLDGVRQWWRDGGFVADRAACLVEMEAQAEARGRDRS